MGNKILALEWLTIAYHDLQSAHILYNANHYTDSIGCDLQQSLEKTIKSLFSFQNLRVPRTHTLVELIEPLKDFYSFTSDDITLLQLATLYYKEDKYPNPQYQLPPREEIYKVLLFATNLHKQICKQLDIDESELL